MVTAGRLCTIDAGAPLHHIQVKLQNALLAQDEFCHWHQRELAAFAKERPASTKEEVFHQLLAEGGPAAYPAAFHIFFGSLLDRVPIKSVMMIETCVLCGDDGMLEVG